MNSMFPDKILKMYSLKFLAARKSTCRNPIRCICFVATLLVAQHLFAQPVITNFTPESGPVGTPVVISGTNFSTTAANNIVYFGAVKAVVSSATSTILMVAVPAGATGEPISVTTNGLTAYSAKPFSISFSGDVAISSVSFASKVNYATGRNPSGVALTDIDSDGKPDVITTNASSNTISVLINQTTGAANYFAAPADFPTGISPANIATGDVDGDGKQDLAVVNSGSNTISVFRNRSTAGIVSFATRVDFPTGSCPSGIAIQDLDEDGKPEIAITNYASNTISVLRNINSGTDTVSFAAKTDYATGNGPSGIAISDMNGDGKPDLAITNTLSNTFSIFKNTGSGGTISFTPKVDFQIFASPADLAISDMDSDGRMDVAMVIPSHPQILVYRNSSTGSNISFVYGLNLITEMNPSSIAIANINGDDKPDIVVANDNAAGSVSVYDNTSRTGSIWFSTKTEFATGNSSRKLALGDVNEDGRPDIIAGNYNDNAVSILLNQIHLLSNAITIGTLSSNTYCIDGPISIPFIATGTYGSDNVFTAELSDGSGIFSNPVAIGMIAGTKSGTINAIIPAATYPFNYYKVRVRSSNPVTIGTPNAAYLTINKAVPIAIKGPQSICQGSDLDLSATSINEATYHWTGPNGFSATTQDISIIDVNKTDSGEYVVIVHQNGCTSGASANVGINPVPAVPSITAGSATTFCLGRSVELRSSSSNGNQWYKDGVAVTNATAANYTASVSGNYMLRTTEGDCISGASEGINVITKPVPDKPVITATDNTLISSAGRGNQWYLNETVISGATKQLYTAQASGQYTVQVTQNECSILSDVFNFVVSEITEPSQLDYEIKIYPNPVADWLFVTNSGLRMLKVQLVNAMGRSVYWARVTTASTRISLKQLTGGSYYFIITDIRKNETIVKKIVKQ